MQITCLIASTGYCLDGDVRLIGGSGYIRGRVEVCYGQVWGTVCGSDWGTVEAQVVCRQLGLVSAGRGCIYMSINLDYDIIYLIAGAVAYGNAQFGYGMGTVYNVQCTLSDNGLGQCKHAISGSCEHNHVAGVGCPGAV